MLNPKNLEQLNKKKTRTKEKSLNKRVSIKY